MQTLSMNAIAAAVKGGAAQAATGEGAAAAADAGGESAFGALLARQLKLDAPPAAPVLPLELLQSDDVAKADTAQLVLEIAPEHPVDPNALAGLVAQALAGLNGKPALARGGQEAKGETPVLKGGIEGVSKEAKEFALPVAADAAGEKSLSREDKAAVIAENGKMLPTDPALRDVPGREAKEALPDQFGDKLAAAQQALVHAAPARAASSAGDIHAGHIDRPVGAPGWGGELGQKVVWMVGQQKQSAELQLNPPNLGPLEVRLSLNQDQMTATFVSHHGAVREAIEAALPRLREMLADSGIALGNVMVGAESFAQQQQQAAAQQGGQGSSQEGFPLAPSVDGEEAAVGGTVRIEGSGLVNTFV